jgi:hypothetical protein
VRSFASLALILSLPACDPGPAPVDAGVDAGPPWPHDLPSATTLGDHRGRRVARAIVHLHSPISHDACDGLGWVDGALGDAECLEHFRDAPCALRTDVLMLTDHGSYLRDVPFEQALWARDGDEVVRDAMGNAIAAYWACPDGHRVFVSVGSENALMPIGLTSHPGDSTDPMVIGPLYSADGVVVVDAFRADGALAWYAHTEGIPIEQLRATQPDGIEIYNIHANVDPRIRMEHLGLDPAGFVATLLRFTMPIHALEPDLAFLTFFAPNGNALGKWDTLLSEGARITGTGGTDAHENAFPQLLADGERADSYRRLLRWHSNHLLVDTVDRAGVMDALDAGRLYVAFEAIGTPVGFDFVAEGAGGAIAEMGDEAAVGATLRVVMPALPPGFPATPPPILRMRILRAEAGGAVEVAAGTGATLEHVTTAAGAYRAEVWMVPEHTRPYLGRIATQLIHDVPWVYSNPIYVR